MWCLVVLITLKFLKRTILYNKCHLWCSNQFSVSCNKPFLEWKCPRKEVFWRGICCADCLPSPQPPATAGSSPRRFPCIGGILIVWSWPSWPGHRVGIWSVVDWCKSYHPFGWWWLSLTVINWTLEFFSTGEFGYETESQQWPLKAENTKRTSWDMQIGFMKQKSLAVEAMSK